MNTSHNLDGTSAHAKKDRSHLKEKAIEEFWKYWAIAIYLAVVLGAFTTYRRLILSESGISYLHHGVALIEALILAKVILIGQALGLARRFENPPLIWSVLFKSLVYGIFYGLFTILEHLIEGLVHHLGWSAIAHSLVRNDRTEILARTIMMIVTFIPFFAFLEADRVMGEGRLFALFFRRDGSGGARARSAAD